MSDWENYLTSIYFDPKHPASLSASDKLYNAIKSDGKYQIEKVCIQHWLQDH